MFRLNNDFILVASLPRDAVSVFGLGSGWVTSCDFAIASFSSTSFRACTSASFRNASFSLVFLPPLETSEVVTLFGKDVPILLIGFDSTSGGDAAVENLDSVRLQSSLAVMAVVGCFTGAIISHTGSVGLEGSEEEDIGRNIVICECPHSPLTCLGEYAGVEGAESMNVPKDLADMGGDIGPGDDGVIGDDSAGELGRTMAENL